MQGGRKLSAWNLFVKKVYSEGKSNNSNYEFKDALKDASKRKSEMGTAVARGTKKVKKSKKSSKRMSKRSMSASAQVAGTRRRRRH